jgi:hypothetical protein
MSILIPGSTFADCGALLDNRVPFERMADLETTAWELV